MLADYQARLVRGSWRLTPVPVQTRLVWPGIRRHCPTTPTANTSGSVDGHAAAREHGGSQQCDGDALLSDLEIVYGPTAVTLTSPHAAGFVAPGAALVWQVIAR